RFEAYVPKAKRRFGYFALPVLIGDEIAALLDLKTDRARQKLLLQQWTWLGKTSRRSHKRRIEEALPRFAPFQLARRRGAQNGPPPGRRVRAEDGRPEPHPGRQQRTSMRRHARIHVVQRRRPGAE